MEQNFSSPDKECQKHKQIFVHFSFLSSLTIAHTDTGDFLVTENGLEKQFLIKGTIIKARAGLFFITIEDKKFTTHKNRSFEVGEEVACLIEPIFKNSQVKDFIIVGLEKIE